MAVLRNVNPLGAVDVPLLGRTLAAGAVFEDPDSVAETLLAQVGNYEKSAKKPTTTVKDA